MPDQRVEARLKPLYDRQDAILRALETDPAKIRRKKYVVDLAVGYHWKRGKRQKHIGPIVFVSKKVRRSSLKAQDRIPRSIKVGGKTMRIDLLLGGKIRLLCATGIADDQHATHISMPPGVALCAVKNGTIPPLGQGSSGAIIKVVTTPQEPARYVLTCDHVVGTGCDWAQPWTTHPIMGSFVGSAMPTFDASLLEAQFYLLDIHCLGVVQKPPIKPLVGMRLMKSGAGTGLTGSLLTAVTGKDVYIDNEPSVPKSTPIMPFNFAAHGDSGSVAWLGTPPDARDNTVNPLDLGEPMNRKIEDVVDTVPPAARPQVRDTLLASYRGMAVALIQGVGPTNNNPITPTAGAIPTRWCVGPQMIQVLKFFSGKLGKPVIIADD